MTKLDKTFYNLQILENSEICIDDSEINTAYLAVCGQLQGPRNYVTSWTSDDPKVIVGVNIFISDTLKNKVPQILEALDFRYLQYCKTADDLLALNKKIVYAEG